ncbi:hypothetical protein TRICI_003567 [Trichomonascus ciferrii]|uniref:Uncharacterized protein n=1 Tax=Trichomonascus ciferrii TaxID=44093 RepID=A0A642V3K7_9ASCO|nr:hypothetical protein TRICI_003567 [Trichomonascus ciferrii]
MAASEQSAVTEAPNVADNGGEVPMNVESFSENSPHFTVDNMSIQMRLRAEKTGSFTRKMEDAIREASSMSETRKNLVIEASGCDDTDIEALNGVLRKLGIKGRRTVEYSAGVYRIVISAELHENIERVLNGLEGDVPDRYIESVKRCLIDHLDVKKAEKRALILVFEHWDDHDEIIRLLKQEFRVEWELYLQKEIEYAYKKKRHHKWILKDLRRTLQRLNEMRERFPPNPPKASLEDYRLCYRVVDDRTREVHVVDCDENGTVADRNAQKLQLHIRPLVGFALKSGDDIHFTNTQLVKLWKRAIAKYKQSAQRRTNVRLKDLTDEGLRWQCKLLGLPTAGLCSRQIQDILRNYWRNGLIIPSNTHIAHNVQS